MLATGGGLCLWAGVCLGVAAALSIAGVLGPDPSTTEWGFLAAALGLVAASFLVLGGAVATAVARAAVGRRPPGPTWQLTGAAMVVTGLVWPAVAASGSPDSQWLHLAWSMPGLLLATQGGWTLVRSTRGGTS